MKDIKGYEGQYAITMSGRVWSYKSNKFLKPYKEQDGYLRVSLRTPGERIPKKFKVHRLVAEAFIPNLDNQPQVGHIDDNPLNNSWDNLYWTNPKNNNNYGKHREFYNTQKRNSQGRFCK